MKSLRIVVTGLAATYPFGGVFWDYMQYPLGLQRLGHDVLYLEDTGKWCYHPEQQTFVESGRANADYLSKALDEYVPELRDRWFFRDGTGETFGRQWSDTVDFCRTADLFIHVSASCWMRDEYFAAERVAFIDSDPMYTQCSGTGYIERAVEPESRERLGILREHDVFFTFGENIGAPDCRVPTGVFPWKPTRQPVVLDCMERFRMAPEQRRRVATTVASWEPHEQGPFVGGVQYRGKSAEFERFIELPAQSPIPLEVALSGPAPRQRLQQHGWLLREGYEVSGSPGAYLNYLASSWCEWSVAKNAYVASRSGWFSCRTACYLALGVPAVVQETGFSRYIPPSAGLAAFETAAEAVEALVRIDRDPPYAAAAARETARLHFDSRQILPDLIARATA